MGLDLALSAIIVLAAIRGWMQGFVSQTVRIGSLIACVYLADLVRSRQALRSFLLEFGRR